MWSRCAACSKARSPRWPPRAPRARSRSETLKETEMKLMITGGGGFVGARLARALLARGTLDGRRIERMVLTDIAPPPADLLADARVEARTGPLLTHTEALRDEPFDGVFHLASAVSGECELD